MSEGLPLQRGMRPAIRLLLGGGLALGLWAAFAAGAGAQEDGSRGIADVSQLESPVPFTEESIRRGRVLYQRHCTECHGADGKAQIDVIADATDLTQPRLWYSGTSEGEVFRSIRDGAGVSMPPYRTHFESDEQIWDVVNFVRSLWPESMRPELVEESAPRDPAPVPPEPPEPAARTRPAPGGPSHDHPH